MALQTLAGFRASFPEFDAVSDERVQSRLDAAAEEIDVEVWGSKAAEGHGLLTAHRLSRSGYGRETTQGATTTYGADYEDLRSVVGRAYRLVLE